MDSIARQQGRGPYVMAEMALMQLGPQRIFKRREL